MKSSTLIGLSFKEIVVHLLLENEKTLSLGELKSLILNNKNMLRKKIQHYDINDIHRSILNLNNSEGVISIRSSNQSPVYYTQRNKVTKCAFTEDSIVILNN